MSLFKLLKFWVREFKRQRKCYLNGTKRYLMHKFGFVKSPSLGGSDVLTYRADIRLRKYITKEGNRFYFKDIFAGITVNPDIDLVSNLKKQVTKFTEWQRGISALTKRGVCRELLVELKNLGPVKLKEVIALNSLSDSELVEYERLWKEKERLWEEQTQRYLKL